MRANSMDVVFSPLGPPAMREATGSAACVPPRLVRLGSVAQVTAKVDNAGNNDGGISLMRRT